MVPASRRGPLRSLGQAGVLAGHQNPCVPGLLNLESWRRVEAWCFCALALLALVAPHPLLHQWRRAWAQACQVWWQEPEASVLTWQHRADGPCVHALLTLASGQLRRLCQAGACWVLAWWRCAGDPCVHALLMLAADRLAAVWMASDWLHPRRRWVVGVGEVWS